MAIWNKKVGQGFVSGIQTKQGVLRGELEHHLDMSGMLTIGPEENQKTSPYWCTRPLCWTLAHKGYQLATVHTEIVH